MRGLGQLRDERGLTLLELLIVLMIVGILLGIAVPAYLHFSDKAHETAAAADVREAEFPAASYYSDHSSYSGMTKAQLRTYDSGLSPRIETVTGGSNHFCISALDGASYAHVVGPGGSVVQQESTNFCATWLPS
ncbi:MAG TPA: prepilin-type N-terminal cleavage/methylation domain-containing protein [Gaiellaceae bacterium]|nr:prepilin-type N-terminal cleavage/methylation domain-containing protein [Gaiellaceae bacterium]